MNLPALRAKLVRTPYLLPLLPRPLILYLLLPPFPLLPLSRVLPVHPGLAPQGLILLVFFL